MNLGLDREETAADRSSQSVDADGDLGWGRGRRLAYAEETDSC